MRFTNSAASPRACVSPVTVNTLHFLPSHYIISLTGKSICSRVTSPRWPKNTAKLPLSRNWSPPFSPTAGRKATRKRYDRALALYPDDLIGWLQETQPQEWAKLAAFYHGDPTLHVLEYVAKLLDKEGALALLRRGFKDGNARFQLCQFKPSHGFNPQLQALYDQVRLRVVRQVHYSLHNENSIDVVLFANGIPLATLELKTDFTQSVQDAIHQYKYDRPPRDPATRQEEPLLAFKRRALVHFAVSTDEVHMTTRLAGAETVVPALQPGQRPGRRQPAEPAGLPHQLPVGAGAGARQLAGDPGALYPPGEDRRSRSGSSSRATTSGRW